MNVIVLAGEKRTASDTPNKAFLLIKNKHMIEYVVDTVRKVRYVDKIAVVGPRDRLEPVLGSRVDLVVDQRDSIVENIMAALSCFPGEKEVLLITSDIPMITVEALEDFIARAKEKDVDLCYSIVDKKVNDAKYPEVRRTYARLWEGQFTGGNVFYFNPAVTDRCRDFVERMLAYRKSPAKMAGVLGVGFLLRLALGILTIRAIQDKCEKLLKIKAAAVISPYPEIGNDVDKSSDLEFVERYL